MFAEIPIGILNKDVSNSLYFEKTHIIVLFIILIYCASMFCPHVNEMYKFFYFLSIVQSIGSLHIIDGNYVEELRARIYQK